VRPPGYSPPAGRGDPEAALGSRFVDADDPDDGGARFTLHYPRLAAIDGF